MLYPDSHFLESEWNDSGLVMRGWYWNLERPPRLSAVFGEVVNLAIGERECLENISQGYSEPSEETHIAVSNGCLITKTSFPWECRLPYSKTFLHLVTHRHFP